MKNFIPCFIAELIGIEGHRGQRIGKMNKINQKQHWLMKRMSNPNDLLQSFQGLTLPGDGSNVVDLEFQKTFNTVLNDKSIAKVKFMGLRREL